MMSQTGLVILIRLATISAALLCLQSFVFSQNSAVQGTGAASGEEKAEQILRRATEAQGGPAYLSVRTITSHGLFTQYQNGASGLPATFTDYLVLPDHERTEFRGQGIRIIQTNVGDKGWIYDGASRTIKDLKPEQVADFQLTLRTSVDNILRGWWRKEGAKLSYVGRREAGLARRNETVRLVYPNGFTVEFEFSATDGLPAKVLYQRKSAEGEETPEEDRFAQYLTINGVAVPFVVDHYRAGVQTSRLNLETVELNRPLPDSLFARPENIKALK